MASQRKKVTLSNFTKLYKVFNRLKSYDIAVLYVKNNSDGECCVLKVIKLKNTLYMTYRNSGILKLSYKNILKCDGENEYRLPVKYHRINQGYLWVPMDMDLNRIGANDGRVFFRSVIDHQLQSLNSDTKVSSMLFKVKGDSIIMIHIDDKRDQKMCYECFEPLNSGKFCHSLSSYEHDMVIDL